MFKKLKITCDEATAICDKTQYGESSFLEKIKLNIHLLLCKLCKLYSKQNSILTILFNQKAIECKSKKCTMSDEDKQVLKKKIKDLF